MSPLSAIERTELCTIATMSAAARAGKLEYVVRAQRPRGVRTADAVAASVPDEDVMPEPRTPYGRSLLEVESIVAGVAVALRRAGRARCATRRSSGRTCRARSAGCCGCRSCRCPRSPIRRSRSCTPTTRPRRWSPRSIAATTARCNVVGPGAATPWQAVRLGGRVPLPGGRPGLWDARVARRRSSRAPRSRRTSSSCSVTAAPATASRARRRARARAARADAGRACASCSSGPTSIPIATSREQVA